MLHWQRLNFLDALKRTCWNRFFIASALLHLVSCFFLFFVYQKYHQTMAVSISKTLSSVAVVKVLPLSASRSLLKDRKRVTKKNGLKQKKHAAEKKTKQLSKAKNSLHSLVSKKKLLKKEIKNKKRIKESSVVEQSKKQQPPVLPQEPVAVESTSSKETQEIVYVTQQEFDALHLQKTLQESLFDLWTPPAGIPAQAVYEVVVTINWDGIILEKEIKKKTGILIYDLSVQEALDKASFPREVWGKKITLSFKP